MGKEMHNFGEKVFLLSCCICMLVWAFVLHCRRALECFSINTLSGHICSTYLELVLSYRWEAKQNGMITRSAGDHEIE